MLKVVLEQLMEAEDTLNTQAAIVADVSRRLYKIQQSLLQTDTVFEEVIQSIVQQRRQVEWQAELTKQMTNVLNRVEEKYRTCEENLKQAKATEIKQGSVPQRIVNIIEPIPYIPRPYIPWFVWRLGWISGRRTHRYHRHNGIWHIRNRRMPYRNDRRRRVLPQTIDAVFDAAILPLLR